MVPPTPPLPKLRPSSMPIKASGAAMTVSPGCGCRRA